LRRLQAGCHPEIFAREGGTMFRFRKRCEGEFASDRMIQADHFNCTTIEMRIDSGAIPDRNQYLDEFLRFQGEISRVL